MRYVLAAAALVLAAPLNAAPPTAKGWTMINDGDEQDHWIRDKDWTAGRPGDRSVLVWTWVDQKRSRTKSHDLILVEIDCPAEAYRFTQIHTYDVRGNSRSLGSTEWEHAAPGTIISNVVEATCMEPGSQDEPQRQGDFW